MEKQAQSLVSGHVNGDGKKNVLYVFTNTNTNANKIQQHKISDMEEQAQSLVTGHVKRYTEDSNTAAEVFRYGLLLGASFTPCLSSSTPPHIAGGDNM